MTDLNVIDSNRLSTISQDNSITSAVGDRVDGNDTRTSRISAQSQLNGEVHTAARGKKSFFLRPWVIGILGVLTGGVYAIAAGIHHLVTKSSSRNANAANANQNINASQTTEVQRTDGSADYGVPKIKNKKQLVEFLSDVFKNPDKVCGKSKECGSAVDDTGTERKLYEFKGIVFRGDSRPPVIRKGWVDGNSLPLRNCIKNDGGFNSQNDLNVPENRQEAMGLGKGKGATGKSGVSCADSWKGAIGYTMPGNHFAKEDNGRLYIIDTTKLNQNEKSYYMKDIVLNNGLQEKDQTGGEVNCTHIPYNAIIGWISFTYMPEGSLEEQCSQLGRWLKDPDYMQIEFNSKYKP